MANQSVNFRQYSRNSDVHRNLELSDIVSKVVQFSCDYHGSKFIQQKIVFACDARKNVIFKEIQPNLARLVTNRYGNYVVQKFLEVGTPEHKACIIDYVAHNCMLSVDKYACRTVQTALKVGTMEQQISILVGLRGRVLHFAGNPSASHVLQIAFENALQRNALDFIITESLNNLHQMCTSLYAYRVIQQIIEHGTESQKSIIMRGIYPILPTIIHDRYGNFVAQRTLEFCEPIYRYFITNNILKEILPLSQQKYSSNVVEKCLSVTNDVQRFLAVNLIISLRTEILWKLCSDPYANYVIQKIIEYATPQQNKCLFQKVRPNFHRLKRLVCGRRIIDLLVSYKQNNNI